MALEIKASTLSVIEPEVQQQAPTQAIAPIEAVSEAEAKAFIYYKESSNRLDAVNSIGCVGIGQSCGGGLESACPDWPTNYECSDQYFTQYVQARYGSWANAHTFWLNNNWY